MTKARDRADRGGSDPIIVGNTRLETDSNNDLVVKDTSDNAKKVIASEVHVGTGADKVILKRSATDGKLQLQTTDGSSTSNSEVSGESGGSGGVTIQEEGSDLSTTATTLNFVGSTVTASGTGATKTITISAGSGGTTTVYANIAAMVATSASAGDQALVTANSGLYIYNGSGWYKIATVNTSPTISSPSTGGSFTMDTGGTATSIELVGADADEGTVLQNSYTVSSGSLTNGGGTTATVTTSSTSGGTYTALAPGATTTNRFFKITPSTDSSYGGSFSLTFSMSDGTNAATTVQSFVLQFGVSGSLYFDGTGDYLSIANTYNLGSADWTIEFWVNFSDFTGNRGVCQLGKDGSGNLGIMVLSTGKLRLLESGVASVFDSNTTFSINTWYHVAITNNDSSNTQIMYVNGVAESNTGSKSTAFTFTETTTILGGRWYSSAFQNPMYGYISNFRVVAGSMVYTSNFTVSTSPLTAVTNTKLLVAKNSDLVSGAATSDESSASLALTFVGDTRFSHVTPFINPTGGSTDFIGATGTSNNGFTYVDSPNTSAVSPGNGDFTIEYWINSRDISADSQFTFDYNYSTASGLMMYINTSGRLIAYQASQFLLLNDGTGSAPLMANNTWYHVALCRNSGQLRMYQNGILCTNTAGYGSEDGSHPFTANLTQTRITIGVKYFGGHDTYPVNGSISNFRLVVGTAVYTGDSSFTPPTSPLTAITNTQLLTCQNSTGTIADASSNNLTMVVGSGAVASKHNPF